jgi:hypothetical protein
MGGGSWKVTGSDGSWLDLFERKMFQSFLFSLRMRVSCWPEDFMQVFEGSPLKILQLAV